MFYIFPVGHDKEVSHFPYVTLAIVAICLSIQLYSSFVPSDYSQAREMHLLRRVVWRQHAREWLKYRGISRPTAVEQYKLYQEFFQDYDAGRVAPKDDRLFVRYKRLSQSRGSLPGTLAYGFRMRDLRSKPYTLITHVFIHGGWMHLIGNMMLLLICGSNLEDRWGRGVWTGFYLFGGMVAGLTFGYFHPDSPQVLVGASGAIAAAMGAFLMLYHNTRIKLFIFFFFLTGTVAIRALWLLPIWMGMQLLGLKAEASGLPIAVAYSAHVGGFVTGMVVVMILKAFKVDEKLSVASEQKAILYEANPLLDQGLNYKEQGQLRLAEASFASLLRQEPYNIEAYLELSRLKDDPQEAVSMASQAIRQAQQSNNDDMIRFVYNNIAERGLSGNLGARTLFVVAKAFEEILPEESFVLFFRIAERFPDSPMVPKAMLEVARMQMESSPYQALDTLQNLVAQHEGTVFADQARAMIRKIENQ